MSKLAGLGELLVILAFLLGVAPYVASKAAPQAVSRLGSLYGALHIGLASELELAGVGFAFIAVGVAIDRATIPRPRMAQGP
ncbi:MAG: hypothetical protein JRN34_05055 [Nitrososphaerota archaeon]|jgi:hypothetical protein|nr:hypothetical protein [Nitrososphaerota archaeon]MDG6942277.1 hypothetical protein [Nitrososphaerota archaeon]MDG6948529.1 hypothetical protein [Nitrososphaerota archaeon]MDG6950455.1 hypothetical protein [Nitrososphaerota archaeon]